MGLVYTTTAGVAGAWFVTEAARNLYTARRDPATATPIRVFVTSNAYLAVLFIAVAIDPLVRP